MSGSDNIFGINFQIDASMVLILKNIKKINNFKVEGDYEDLELELINGHKIFAQMKSVRRSTDNPKNHNKLDSAIKSLSKVPLNPKYSMVYCSNQKSPFINSYLSSDLKTIKEVKLNDLPEVAVKLVKDLFVKYQCSSDFLDRFDIISIPYFDSVDTYIKRKFIINEVKDFLELNRIDLAPEQLRSKWYKYLEDIGANKTKPVSREMFLFVIVIVDIDQNYNMLSEEFPNKKQLMFFDRFINKVTFDYKYSNLIFMDGDIDNISELFTDDEYLPDIDKKLDIVEKVKYVIRSKENMVKKIKEGLENDN